tara:strand:+ start:3273 stop:4139 length:867 start_codon:yes stop_codon:yes gene_type:complete
MTLKCYNRTRKDGSSYTTCNKGAQEKNEANNKMPPKKYPKGTSKKIIDGTARADSPHQFWNEAQIKLGQRIRSLIPEDLAKDLFGHNVSKTGKAQRTHLIGVRRIPELEAYAKTHNSAELNTAIKDWHKDYATFRKMMKDRKAGVGVYAKKEDEVRPATTAKTVAKPQARAKAARKINVSYRVGSGPMKQGTGIVGKKPGAVKARVVSTTKQPTRARARKSAPVKNAQTAPQKIASYDMKTGRTGNALYEMLGQGIGIPRYGMAAPTPDKSILKRNIRKGARGAHMLY